uniref:methyltransferase n=1 Tax=Paenibacillus forsythiae TaxID=365616 RepID=UPI00056C1C82
MNVMDELLGRMLLSQLQTLGLAGNGSLDELREKAGLPAQYHKWLKESLIVLAQREYLRYDGQVVRLNGSGSSGTQGVWEEWERKKTQWLNDPDMKAQAVLVEATLRALPDILTGRTPATDIMFPNASMELVEGIYKQNRMADAFNEVLAETAAAYVEERIRQDASATIRILEIGAGTGGTSAMVFRKLEPYQKHVSEYSYTDLSKAFLLHAEKEYGERNPSLSFHILDIERPVGGQGIPEGGYDVVIAANVLHATANIRQTLRNAKAALRQGGILLLNELSENSLFAHLTFGLLEGWWRYEDAELRIPGCPGLYPETWRTVLEEEGFGPVHFPARTAHEWGTQIIVAESNGIVRKRVEAEAERIADLRQSRNDERGQAASDPKGHVQPQIRKARQGADVTDEMIAAHVRTIIRENIADALKMDEARIRDDRSFSEYGVDSITAVNLVNRINKAIGI